MRRRSSHHVVLAVFALLLWTALGAQAVSVSRTGDVVTVKAPSFSFIKGEPLARLKDGRSLRVDLDMAILPKAGAASVTQARQSFILSYDLWEERFAVTRVGTPSKSAAYLTSMAAEAWCFEQLTVSANALGALAKDVPFWVRLEYRILEGDAVPAADNNGGYTLQSLIDSLSLRRNKAKAQEWAHSIEVGPLRLKP